MNSHSAPPRRGFTRRQFIVLTLAAGSCGLCGLASTGGLATLLILRRRLEMETVTAVAAQAPTATPTLTPLPIVPREAWNARPVNHAAENEKGFASASNPLGWYVYEGDLAQIYRTVALHHSYPIRRDTGTMRQIQDLHLDGDKWADIGYHFGIDGKGIIYAGRDIHVRGSSVAGYNTGTLGVVLIGDFQSETPSPEQIAAFTTLVRWLKATYGLTHLAGHFEFNPETVCPGKNAIPYLDPIAKLTMLQRGTGGYQGPTPFPSATPQLGACCGSARS
ncbi:MAG TPA: peptidoglycan recognition family protein [Aggregatilineales bacterium]|nr:peptidoglycan recognition family protein [Aggregatilineales bacterium]